MPESGGKESVGVTLWGRLPTQFQTTVSPTSTVTVHSPFAKLELQNQMSPTSMATVAAEGATPPALASLKAGGSSPLASPAEANTSKAVDRISAPPASRGANADLK